MDDTYLDEIVWGVNNKWWPEERNKREAKYLDSLIKFMEKKTKTSYHKVLDIPCGTGRIDKHLRKYGYEVYGIDLNSNFIRKVKKNDKKHSSNYVKADMRSFKLPHKFDFIISWSASFGYYDDKQNLATLKSISKHLNKNGVLLLDVPNKEWRLANTNPDSWEIEEFPDVSRLTNSSIIRKGAKTFLLFKNKVYLKNGKDLILKRDQTSPIRLYTDKEITDLLRKAGLSVRYRLARMLLKQSTKNKIIMYVSVKK